MDLQLYLEQLEILTNIDSGSHHVLGITEVADYLGRWYQALGWTVIRHDLGQETGPLLEICNRPSDHYDVMLVGHMDTVFPDGTVKERPFTRDEVNCYGPGVADMKNGCLAMYHVAANLPKQVSDKLSICMVYNPDEEIGSIYSKELLDQIGCRSNYIFVMESAGGQGERHCFARKGSLRYEIDFYGQAAHSGFMFELDHASAVLEMGHYIVTLMGLCSRQEDTTVNVGIARGGTATNVVADHAHISVEMRFKKLSEKLRLEEALNRLVQGPAFVQGVKTVISQSCGSPPFVRSEQADAYIKRLERLAGKLNIPFEGKDRGGLSDANHLALCPGVVCLDGMGPQGALDHSEKEYSQIQSVIPCVTLLCEAFKDLSEET